jgi:hypothetical protein
MGMRPPTEPALTPLSGELEIVEEPAAEPILLTAVKEKKGKGGLIVFFVLVILAAGVVAAYFFRDTLFGERKTQPPQPEPVAGAPPPPSEEPHPVVDAGLKPGETPDAGDGTDGKVEKEPEHEPEPRPGIVAFAEGKGAGSIRVVSKPKKARVYLDGVNTGKFTPVTLQNVPAGRRHAILVDKTGRRPAFGVVDLDSDQKALANFSLRRKGRKFKGRIPVRIESEPPGAAVFVEGGKVKNTTPTEIRLRADRSVRLDVVKSGYEKWVRTIRPVPGMDITILVKLNK